jgi:hypothetical protein
MATAAHRDQNIVFAGEAHALDHVGGAGAAGNEGRPAVNHGVRKRSGEVITLLTGAEGLAAKRLPQLLDRGFG